MGERKDLVPRTVGLFSPLPSRTRPAAATRTDLHLIYKLGSLFRALGLLSPQDLPPKWKLVNHS